MKIITLDQNKLKGATQELLGLASQSCTPMVVIGIATGGKEMLNTVRSELENKGMRCGVVRCQRPMTKKKKDFSKLLKKLPRWLTNSLRIAEHYYRQAFRKQDVHRAVEIIEPVEINEGDRVLVLDDAADTGVTLMHVEKFIRQQVGHSIEIHFAVITRTGKKLAKEPSFFLFDSTLVRFPWSNDY
jgi:hypoxanthine phosphoribosyltransferase